MARHAGRDWHGHLHLHASDIPSAVQFYTEGLGLDTVSELLGQTPFMSSEIYHYIAINVWNGVGAPKPPPDSVGLNTFIMNYPDAASLNNAVRRFEYTYHEIGSKDSAVVYDPSANKVIMATE